MKQIFHMFLHSSINLRQNCSIKSISVLFYIDLHRFNRIQRTVIFGDGRVRVGVGIRVPRPGKCGNEIGGRIVIGSGEWANRLEIVAGNDIVGFDPIATPFFFFFSSMMLMLWFFVLVLGFHEVDEVLVALRRRRSMSEIHYLLVHERRRIHRYDTR